MKRYLIIALLLTGCATSPEARLKQGYDATTAIVKTATILVNREQIGSDEAFAIHATGTNAKVYLDIATGQLQACKTLDVAKKCPAAEKNLKLATSMLLELENYLKAQE